MSWFADSESRDAGIVRPVHHPLSVDGTGQILFGGGRLDEAAARGNVAPTYVALVPTRRRLLQAGDVEFEQYNETGINCTDGAEQGGKGGKLCNACGVSATTSNHADTIDSCQDACKSDVPGCGGVVFVDTGGGSTTCKYM